MTYLKWDYDELVAATDSFVGRPYFADELVETGVVEDVQSAFDEYLTAEAECFVEMERLEYQRVIDVIYHAGGFASLAQPAVRSPDEQTVEGMVKTLADPGLDTIEVIRTRPSTATTARPSASRRGQGVPERTNSSSRVARTATALAP